jgi:hypothetical protein
VNLSPDSLKEREIISVNATISEGNLVGSCEIKETMTSEYEPIRELHNLIAKKHNEQIVLRKI